ncbi:nucleotidyltransferase domain-containing protein [Butyrivibrio sp. WCD3002]|uniref:nucleotidyltransferase domain-containing protein n=1 Tax=Butyrivibrio sp. WCD3002 TaxID=1280676 RepID=UPI00047AC6CC|nr:nucleotidyltransferase domain-containing protein [Butyrivibrio sp. WCD3002]
MREAHKKMIDAVIAKGLKVCPESLALVGIYGSVSTKEEHPMSDLDLLIVIDDEQGRQLSKTFILDDEGIGYDIYCTTWEMLEGDAECSHSHISKLMDSEIVYSRDEASTKRLEELRQKAAEMLASDEIIGKVLEIRDQISREYGYVAAADSIGMQRAHASFMISLCFDAVILWNHRYFKRSGKYAFEELKGLNVPENFSENIDGIIRADDSEKLIASATKLLKSIVAFTTISSKKAAPTKETIAGAYEESFSNWRNKMYDALERGDVYSSFMNLACLQSMMDDIGSELDIQKFNVMEDYRAEDLKHNAELFDSELERFGQEYKKIGLDVLRYKDADDFIADYLRD